VVHVHPEDAGSGKDGNEFSVGSAEIIHLYVYRPSGFCILELIRTLAFGSTIVLFLAYRFIPLPYLLYLHIGRATTTIIRSHRPKPRLSVDCTGEPTVSRPNSN
jgi:hypothetical protein